MLDTGIAYQDVDPAIGIDHRRHAGIDRRFIGDVHFNRHRRAAGLDDTVRRRLAGVQLQVCDTDLCAFGRVGFRDFLADTAGSAGDQGYFVFKAHGVSPVKC